MSRQKELEDLGFSGGYQPVAQPSPVERIVAPRNPGVVTFKPWMIVVVAVVAGAAVFGLMKLVSSAGKDIAKHNDQVIGQIDVAKDADAKLTVHTAFIAAKTLFVENVTYTDVSPASLSLAEPTFRYTTGPSTGPKVVSVFNSATQLGIAVSAGKTCWYLADSVTSGTTFGSGSGACTGAVAISVAKAQSW